MIKMSRNIAVESRAVLCRALFEPETRRNTGDVKPAFFFLINFYWHIVALHCCDRFCCIAASILCFHASTLLWVSFPFRSLEHEQSSLCSAIASHQLLVLFMAFLVYICQSQSPSSSHHHPFPLRCSLCLCLSFCFCK